MSVAFPVRVVAEKLSDTCAVDFDSVTEAQLRQRTSAKWSNYPADVLPAWVAEMDFPLAAPIADALRATLDASDTGYAFPNELGGAFSRWALRSFDWNVAPTDVHLVSDVVTGIAEILRVATSPGDRVVIDPPVYAPFAGTIRSLGREVVEAPLAFDSDGWRLDLRAIERAYATAPGVRAHLLCSPQNPTGRVHRRAELAALAELADRYDVLVLSDEIHAPLTLPGASHHAFPTVSDAAKRRGIVLTSASKTWNVAGLKAAMMVASSAETREVLAKLPHELPYHAGHWGVVAARAAFAAGEPWRQAVIAHLDRNRRLLAELLAENIPQVRYIAPEASYLAWLDCRALEVGPDPARAFLQKGRVALSSGPSFGTGGAGFARLNIATSRTLLEEAIRRMRIALD